MWGVHIFEFVYYFMIPFSIRKKGYFQDLVENNQFNWEQEDNRDLFRYIEIVTWGLNDEISITAWVSLSLEMGILSLVMSETAKNDTFNFSEA